MSTSDRTPCSRFEKHGLLLLEQGHALDEHYQSCPDCIESIRTYQALQNLIASSSSSVPNAGWQDEVLTEIAKQDSDPKPDTFLRNISAPKWFGAIAAGVMAFGIASVFLADTIFQRSVNSSSQSSLLELSVLSSGQDYRGSTAKIGDTLLLQNKLPDDHKQTDAVLLRLYRDGIEYFSCGAVEQCAIFDKNLKQEVMLDSHGEYQAIMFLESETLEGTTGKTAKQFAKSKDLDTDVLWAMEADQKIIISKPLIVR